MNGRSIYSDFLRLVLILALVLIVGTRAAQIIQELVWQADDHSDEARLVAEVYGFDFRGAVKSVREGVSYVLTDAQGYAYRLECDAQAGGVVCGHPVMVGRWVGGVGDE
jgi:hypothetical protein